MLSGSRTEDITSVSRGAEPVVSDPAVFSEAGLQPVKMTAKLIKVMDNMFNTFFPPFFT